jgi:hypothetical protein
VRLRHLLPLTLATAGLTSGLPASLVTSAEAAVPARRIVVTQWSTDEQLAEGRSRGVRIQDGAIRLTDPVAASGNYEIGSWRSPWVRPGYDFTELVPSWEGSTPGASFIKVEVRGRSSARSSSWDTIANWSLGDRAFTRRSSSDSQGDDLGRTAYDTWLTSGASAWQVRVTLHRRTGGQARPAIEAVGAMASALPNASSVSTSRAGAGSKAALGKVLSVPSYSQMVHEGQYPQYDGGGEAWCSPTSLTMVLDYYHALPAPRQYRWVKKDYPDRVVAHHARMTYDDAFGGTGNWPFNTAYAASRVGAGAGGAFVTRLRSLTEAERFIAAGIPLIASITFSSGQLSGAPISSTNGHLLVIVGFRDNGDVVVNDPAASSRSAVRRVYDRGQFEDAWLKRYASGSSMRGSGGVVYVVHDDAHPLPTRDGNRNW